MLDNKSYMSIGAIAKRTSIEKIRMLRLLRAANEIGLVDLRSNRVKSTDALKLLSKSSSFSLASLIKSRGITTYGPWSRLSGALASSKTAFELFYGMNVGQYLEDAGCNGDDQDERCEAKISVRDRIQKKREICHSVFENALLTVPWEQIIMSSDDAIICDVGSGDQTFDLSLTIDIIFNRQDTFSNVKVHGIVFDLPGVFKSKSSEEYEYVEGNIFSSIPSADVYVMKHLLHAGDDVACIQILEVVRANLRRNGIIIVIDPILNKKPGTQYLGDLNLFVTGGGRDRTYSEWAILFLNAGLEIVHVEKKSEEKGDDAFGMFCGSSIFVLRDSSD